ncbi:MAG: TonB-dependent receptor [Gammaproteobacteria bacterium]|nr:TonB-dependent receptor [Gammaproteobacteria bacterium]MBU1625226.1 TonB-dependent receptor [Gammaproteobacteria bacterium]MBU1981486.1 TonB-dependent receptor [Gammaproteobacteria bacterium]
MKTSSKQIAICVALALSAPQASWAEIGALPEVTVSSTTIDDRFDSKRGEPSNVNHISGNTVDEQHSKNIVEVLESIPGVSAEVQSGDSVKIMLRGVEAQRYMGEKPGVAIVIDGVPVQERTGRVNIDLDNIESIKVIKGGASYLFGEDALSGAVIITTKRGAKMAGYMASAEVGSYEYYKGVLRAGFAEGRWVGHIQKSKLQSKTFHDQGDWGRDYVDGKLQYMIDDTSDMTFGFEHALRNKDSHGTVKGVTAAMLDPTSVDGGKDYARKYDVTLDKFNLSYSKDTGTGSNLMVNTYLFKDHTFGWQNPNGFLRDSTGAFLYGTSTASDMSTMRDAYVSGRDTQQQQSGAKAEWRQSGTQVAWMGGLDLQQFEDRTLTNNLVTYTSRSTAVGFSNPLNLAGALTEDSLSTSDTRAIYGELKWQLSTPLTATFNARFDNIGQKYVSNLPLTATQIAEGRSTTGEKTFNVLSERIGFNYAFNEERELYTNLSTGFRVPTVSQLYGGTITPTGTVAANPDLKPEHSYNAEVGLRAKTELLGVGLDTDVAIFQIDRKDFILNTGGQYQSTTGATLTNALEQYQNIGGVRNRGLEVSIKTDSREVWSADMAYTYLNAVFTRNDTYWMSMGSRSVPLASVLYNNTGNVVPRTPKHKLNLTSRYRPMEGWIFTGEMNTQSGIYADEVNVVWVGGRTVYNMMANYEFKSDGKMKWSAFARIDNLFDRYYYSTIRGGSDGNGDGVYDAEDVSITVNPGRVWTIGASLSF